MNWNKWERLHRQRVSYQLTPGHKTGSDRTACSGHTTQTERKRFRTNFICLQKKSPELKQFPLNISEQRFRLLEFAPICFDKKNRDPSRITNPPVGATRQAPAALGGIAARFQDFRVHSDAVGEPPRPAGRGTIRCAAATYGTTEYNWYVWTWICELVEVGLSSSQFETDRKPQQMHTNAALTISDSCSSNIFLRQSSTNVERSETRLANPCYHIYHGAGWNSTLARKRPQYIPGSPRRCLIPARQIVEWDCALCPHPTCEAPFSSEFHGSQHDKPIMINHGNLMEFGGIFPSSNPIPGSCTMNQGASARWSERHAPARFHPRRAWSTPQIDRSWTPAPRLRGFASRDGEFKLRGASNSFNFIVVWDMDMSYLVWIWFIMIFIDGIRQSGVVLNS